MSFTTVPLPQASNYPPQYPQGEVESPHAAGSGSMHTDPDWMRIGVGVTLLTGSLLLLTGKRKAGLVATFAGTALAVLEHRETVREWWDALPGYLDSAQQLLDQATSAIDDLTAKRDKIMSLLGR